ncbi:MAG: WG repeat-containing protein [Oscillospiraceae bacterium]|nr:WG repeat-containing protein [Oscillospiraceae bacterium]
MKKVLPWLLALVPVLLLTACRPAEEEEPPEPTPTEILSPEPAETPAGSFEVYTDWSKLEPYEPKKAVYTRRYEGFTDTLIPSNDYGPLLAFGGVAVSGLDDWDGDGILDLVESRLYGLVTAEYEVVLDPVLSSVVSLYGTDGWRNESFNAESMLLGKMIYNEEGEAVERFALCDREGRWCTDFLYTYDWDMDFGLSFAWGVPLFTQDSKLVFLDPGTGRDIWTVNLPARLGTADFSIQAFDIDPASGWVCLSVTYFDQEAGWTRWEHLFIDPQGVVRKPPEEVRWVNGYGDGLILATVSEGTGTARRTYDGYVDAFTGKWAIEPIYKDATRFVNGVAPVNDGESIYFINTAGEALTGDLEVMPEKCGRYWYVRLNAGRSILAIYDEDANPVTDSPLLGATAIERLGDNWMRGKIGSDYVLARSSEAYVFPGALGTPTEVQGDRVLFEGERVDKDHRVMTLTDLGGNIIAQWDSYSGGYFRQEGYLYLYVYGQPGEDATYDVEGNFVCEGYVTISGGLIRQYEDDCTMWTDLEGNVVFCWPVYGAD